MEVWKILMVFLALVSYSDARMSCKSTKRGRQYTGKISYTKDGYQCKRWDSGVIKGSRYIYPKDFPDASLKDAHNYCRNPDKISEGPWCFTTEPSVKWQACDVPRCLDDCKTTKLGKDYKGQTAFTKYGYVCQPWDCDGPKKLYGTDDPNQFPEASLAEAGSYCRNPDNSSGGPWCTYEHWRREVSESCKSKAYWQYCDVPLCSDLDSPGCKTTKIGKEYKGKISYTKDGYNCQAWASQKPNKHKYTNPDDYPDASLKDAGNYCRNPDGYAEGPWCYTTQPGVGWKLCDIPTC